MLVVNLPDSFGRDVHLMSLHKFNPTKQPRNLRNLRSSKTVKRGAERRGKPNHIRTKTQISEDKIALFPRSTKSGSYKGQLAENSNTDTVLTSHTVDLNSIRTRQLHTEET